MDRERRRPIAGSLTAGVALPAAAVLRTATASADPPPEGVVSFAFAVGNDQTVANGTWTKINWTEIYEDNDDYLIDDDDEISLQQGGLYNIVAEVAWPSNTTGIRQVRIVQDWGFLGILPTAVGTTNPGLSLPPGQFQHQQVTLQAGGTGSCWVEVYQNSGGNLTCKRDGFTAPLLMIARYGPTS